LLADHPSTARGAPLHTQPLTAEYLKTVLNFLTTEYRKFHSQAPPKPLRVGIEWRFPENELEEATPIIRERATFVLSGHTPLPHPRLHPREPLTIP
jgi:hypothetical protein